MAGEVGHPFRRGGAEVDDGLPQPSSSYGILDHRHYAGNPFHEVISPRPRKIVEVLGQLVISRNERIEDVRNNTLPNGKPEILIIFWIRNTLVCRNQERLFNESLGSATPVRADSDEKIIKRPFRCGLLSINPLHDTARRIKRGESG